MDHSVTERNLPVAGATCRFGYARGPNLGEVFDHSNQLLGAVALLAREAHKLTRARDNLTALGRPSDRDPAPAPELEQTFVAQDAKSTKHRVRVDTENRGEIARRGQP
jgi:hypothetical protein